MINKKRIFIVVIICMVFYITFNVVQICNYKEYSEEKSDVAIVLGASCKDNEVSNVYKQRLNHAINLYNEKIISYIITTGGIGKGNDLADATIAKDYLVKNGVDKDVIFEEKESTITQENLENAKKIMDEKNYNTALIVSDPLHMKRSMLLAKDIGISSKSSPTKTSAYESLKSKIPFVARETFFYIGYKWYRLFR